MKTPLDRKSSLSEIETRFNNDVDRFSDLDTGQIATIDAPLAMELITQAAVAATPTIRRCLDIGCGAGNNTIKLLRSHPPGFESDLCDLSLPMLTRAKERITQETSKRVRVFQGDFRSLDFEFESYDVILAAAVLHHLRDDQDWEEAFTKVFRLLRPGGSFWITDMVSHESEQVHTLMWSRYAAYLTAAGGEDYQRQVFDYIDKEDSPKPATYQIELMKRVGFRSVDLLHKNSCFAAFGGMK